MSQLFADNSVSEMLRVFGHSLTQSGVAERFELLESDGVRLKLYRACDGKTASVAMTATTEVYFLDLDDLYHLTDTAYDPPSKTETLTDFMGLVKLFMEKRYVEELYERKGNTIAKEIHLNGADGPVVLSASVDRLSAVNRLLGYTRRIVNP